MLSSGASGWISEIDKVKAKIEWEMSMNLWVTNTLRDNVEKTAGHY